MRQRHIYTSGSLTLFAMVIMLMYSCRKDGNPNDLPDVNPADYAGKIEGYASSEEVYTNNIVGYWSFDNNKNEARTGIAPTREANATLVDGGVRGKALNLAGGYLHYATQFPQFKTDSLKSWTISMWVKIKNNGSKQTMVLQLARPGYHWGNINVQLNTQSYPATNDSVIRLQPRFTTANATVTTTATSGLQDNLNSQIDKFNLNDWLFIVLTYDINTGVFNNWINGVKVGNFSNRGTNPTTQLFKSWEPNELILGANYNAAGVTLNTNTDVAPMTGMIDELRVYNTPLPDAHIKALYSLGKARK
jgi:hypothetical protein